MYHTHYDLEAYGRDPMPNSWHEAARAAGHPRRTRAVRIAPARIARAPMLAVVSPLVLSPYCAYGRALRPSVNEPRRMRCEVLTHMTSTS